jgi:hypothetical protein
MAFEGLGLVSALLRTHYCPPAAPPPPCCCCCCCCLALNSWILACPSANFLLSGDHPAPTLLRAARAASRSCARDQSPVRRRERALASDLLSVCGACSRSRPGRAHFSPPLYATSKQQSNAGSQRGRDTRLARQKIKKSNVCVEFTANFREIETPRKKIPQRGESNVGFKGMKCGAHDLVINNGSLWNIVHDAHRHTVSGTRRSQ